MAVEELRDDDPDYLIIQDYKAAHNIVRDCNTADVVVLMRRARSTERTRLLRIVATALDTVPDTISSGAQEYLSLTWMDALAIVAVHGRGGALLPDQHRLLQKAYSVLNQYVSDLELARTRFLKKK